MPADHVHLLADHVHLLELHRRLIQHLAASQTCQLHHQPVAAQQIHKEQQHEQPVAQRQQQQQQLPERLMLWQCLSPRSLSVQTAQRRRAAEWCC